jgi:two-component system chemotaxis sensor kinase CheA
VSPEFSPDLHAELLDDFYAECDEHLANLRGQLVLLEVSLDNSRANPAALESLYRSFHTFKGNAAIVGLGLAEELAHAAEGLLRALTRCEIPVTAGALDLLGQAGHKLEQIVTTFRLKQPLPDTTALLAQFRPYCATVTTPAAPWLADPSTVASDPIAETAAQHGLLAWQAIFSPTADLDARGVNLTAVRARLGALGRILRVVPSIHPGGVMTFEFALALRAVVTDLAAWAADGIALTAREEPGSVDDPVLPEREGRTGDHPSVDETAPASMFIAPSHIVRVDLGRLDELMRIAGEMVIHRSRLEERIARLTGDRTALQEVNLAFVRSLRELRTAITRVRLVPMAEIFTRLPFVTRDLSRETGKKLRLVLEGQETEVDKYLVERLKEPLLHLVRNAVSHGVESPVERQASAKPEEATLLLRAAATGDSVVIQIRDDGRGIDLTRVAQRAKALGLVVPEPLDGTALLNLLCAPGFSTREQADRAAGRGVGMAVVANTVRELGGSLSLDTSPGQWTQFTLRLPLTLSIAGTFIVSAGAQTCAVPQGFVEEIFRIATADVRRINQAEVVSYRSGVLPLVQLRSIFGAAPTESAHVTVLVVSSERGTAGLVVDRVHGQREVVVRPMRDPLIHVRGISGATELGDGKPVLILDAVTLTSGAFRPHGLDSEAARLPPGWGGAPDNLDTGTGLKQPAPKKTEAVNLSA